MEFYKGEVGLLGSWVMYFTVVILTSVKCVCVCRWKEPDRRSGTLSPSPSRSLPAVLPAVYICMNSHIER